MPMRFSTDLSAPILDALYTDALLLADEVRAAFAHALIPPEGAAGGIAALSAEGLRATTRMMQVLAWLLNRRAFLDGNLSARQLDRLGRFPADPLPEPERLALLEPETVALVAETRALHARIARLDRRWHDAAAPPAIGRLQNRLRQAVGVL